MNLSKALLLTVILTATGLVVLPNTVSLFAGQHYWYNLSSSKNDVPCEKCHADIFEELKQSAFHTHFNVSTGTSWTQATSDNTVDRVDCEGCHRANLSITYAAVGPGYTKVTVGKQAHAASVVACMLCHDYNESDVSTLHGPPAGTFNISYWVKKGIISTPYNYTNDTNWGEFEAHNAFVAMAIYDKTLQDSNEACIACHTHVAVKINWTHARSLEFKVGLGNPITTTTGPHNWTVTQWNYNGTAWAIVWGNTTGYGATDLANVTWPGKVPNVNYNTS